MRRPGDPLYKPRLTDMVEKPRYKCKHVQAGFLTAARIVGRLAIIDVCQECYEKSEQRLLDDYSVIDTD